MATTATTHKPIRLGEELVHIDDPDLDAVLATVATVSGSLDTSAVDVLADEFVELVFALPTTDVVLDLRDVDEVCPACAEVIRNARLALEDQGAGLTVQCHHELESALAKTGADLDVI